MVFVNHSFADAESRGNAFPIQTTVYSQFDISITVSIALIVNEVLLMTSYSKHPRVLKAPLGITVLLFQQYFYVCLLAVLVLFFGV